MRRFLSQTNEEWQLIISDTGPYSLNNLEHVKYRNMLPVIRARSDIKTQPVKELKKGYYFNTDFIPPEWSAEFFLFIFNFRLMIEQENSYNHTYYNAGRMNTRGMEAAIKHQKSIYILELLKALTAYKLGRSDLVMKPSSIQSRRSIKSMTLIFTKKELKN